MQITTLGVGTSLAHTSGVLPGSVASNILPGTMKYVKTVTPDDNVFIPVLISGIVLGTLAGAGFVEAVPGSPDNVLLILGSFPLTSTVILGATAHFLSINNQVRKLLAPFDRNQKKLSALKILKMRLSLKPKKTVIALGRNSFGEVMQAVVTSHPDKVRVEYVALPEAIDVWDKAMKSVAELHTLESPGFPSQKVNAS